MPGMGRASSTAPGMPAVNFFSLPNCRFIIIVDSRGKINRRRFDLRPEKDRLFDIWRLERYAVLLEMALTCIM
jgi:hypothetical protein